ncbi:MAG TPA: beta-ketoacyl-ACP synthase III [Acidimicrobiales bacterium]|nr:MAG: 3-oxoacyl-ACP synthase [Actinobacteria bacterium 21-73-9]HQU25868.1 beta-ketoacyl-ACP synthase III [Acidimicrobiales bacterium]
MGARFIGWGTAVPDRVITNDELSQTLDTSDEWITERTGIKERRVGGSARTLGAEAGRRALSDAGLEPGDVDFLILATTTPDRITPATATLIAHDLGLSCPAMDLNAACSGFMYAVRTAYGLIETGTRRVLVMGAENLSRWTDWNDRNTAVLLADGAGAAVLEYDPTENDLLSFSLGAEGADADLLTCEHGGHIQMDGKEVFRRAVRVVVDSAEKALAAAGVSADQLSLVVPHQANIRIIQAACQRLNVEMDRAVVVLDRYGNTSSASIPLAVVDARANDRLHKGDYALLTGFGAGMTWASAVVRWSR